MHRRAIAAQFAQGGGQYAGVHRVLQIADAQAAFVAAAEPACQRFQPVGMGQQGPRLGQEGTAIGGQPDALLRAFEQLQFQPFLQLGDLPAERGLGDGGDRA